MTVEVDGQAAGFLRWELFWDQVPFMNLLWVLPDWRGQGIGTALIAAWEKYQRSPGHKLVLTSPCRPRGRSISTDGSVMSTAEPCSCPTNRQNSSSASSLCSNRSCRCPGTTSGETTIARGAGLGRSGCAFRGGCRFRHVAFVPTL